MNPRPLAALLLLAIAAVPAPADDWAAFLAEYGPHHDKLTAHLWRNVKVAGVRKQYETLPPAQGEPLFSERFSAVGGADRLLYRETEFDFNPAGRFKGPRPFVDSGYVITPDAQFLLFRANGRFQVLGGTPPWGRNGPGSYYAAYERGAAGLAWPLYAAYIERGPDRYKPMYASYSGVRTVVRGNYLDQAVVTVRRKYSVPGSPDQERCDWTEAVHHRLPDYLVVGREKFLSVDAGSDRRTEVVEVGYGPPQPDTGLPFPATARAWAFGPDGYRTLCEDVTFTEYLRYTPTADDLDTQTQFGFTLRPSDPQPPLPKAAEWDQMLRDGPPRPPESGAATPGPPPAPWPHPKLTAGLALVGCVVLAAVAYRRLRV